MDDHLAVMTIDHLDKIRFKKWVPLQIDIQQGYGDYIKSLLVSYDHLKGSGHDHIWYKK